MARPTQALINEIAPPREVGLPVMDTRGVYRIKQADLKEAMRIPRGGPHGAELVATKRFYDGSTGGESGYYANVFVVFKMNRSTWRTQGVRVLPPEAARIARALRRGTASKPPWSEEPRLSGTGSGTVTELRAEPVGAAVLLFVRFRHGSRQELVRSRGVEVRAREREAVAEGLLKLAKRGSRAR
jgi:hypothetical protein